MEEFHLHEVAKGLTKTNLELEQLSRIDALTGVHNRRHFDERLSYLIETSERYGRPLSLIIFDIDHFKQFNDDFGHEAGDSVLKEVAKDLNFICRNTDIFARFGGEEFVVLCPETSVRGATRLAEKLLDEIHQIDVPYRPITASFGVASLITFSPGSETLLQRADTALYQAKHEGRNRICVDPNSILVHTQESDSKAA
jgi:diguanylate cyclase (GGDEF)-like protein